MRKAQSSVRSVKDIEVEVMITHAYKNSDKNIPWANKQTCSDSASWEERTWGKINDWIAESALIAISSKHSASGAKPNFHQKS